MPADTARLLSSEFNNDRFEVIASKSCLPCRASLIRLEIDEPPLADNTMAFDQQLLPLKYCHGRQITIDATELISSAHWTPNGQVRCRKPVRIT